MSEKVSNPWHSAVWALLLVVVGILPSHADEPAKKYPPYPDVWDWVAPHPERIDGISFEMLPLDNGDVLITYTEAVPIGEATPGTEMRPGSADEKIASITAKVSGKGKKPKTRNVLHQVTLFGGQRVVGVSSNVRLLRRQISELMLDDGTTVGVLPERMQNARLVNGEEISSPKTYPTFGRNVSYATDCYNGPARDGLVASVKRSDEGGGTDFLASVIVFKTLDKPRTIRLDRCPYEEDQTFRTKIESLPIRVAYVLDDRTFFAEIETGVLMRFDGRFNTKSSLAFTKFFPVQGWDVYLGQDYLEQLTGKKYYFPGTYHYDYQRMVDDVYQHLLELKKRATK